MVSTYVDHLIPGNPLFKDSLLWPPLIIGIMWGDWQFSGNIPFLSECVNITHRGFVKTEAPSLSIAEWTIFEPGKVSLSIQCSFWHTKSALRFTYLLWSSCIGFLFVWIAWMRCCYQFVYIPPSSALCGLANKNYNCWWLGRFLFSRTVGRTDCFVAYKVMCSKKSQRASTSSWGWNLQSTFCILAY